MIAIDAVQAGLVIGLVVLAVALTVIVVNRPPAPPTVRVARPATPSLVPGPRPTPVVIQHSGPVPNGPAGQLPRPPDDLLGQRLTAETGAALAAHFADSDPARIVEVISFWMQEDSDEPGSNPFS